MGVCGDFPVERRNNTIDGLYPKKKKNTIDGEKEEKGSFHNIYMWSHMEENLELAWEEFVNRVERVDLLRPLT